MDLVPRLVCLGLLLPALPPPILAHFPGWAFGIAQLIRRLARRGGGSERGLEAAR